MALPYTNAVINKLLLQEIFQVNSSMLTLIPTPSFGGRNPLTI
jgi:hypothetical protein